MKHLAIQPHELRELLDSDKDIVLIDVRPAEERAVFSIEDSVWIPAMDLPPQVYRLFELGQLVVFCNYGDRSHGIAKWLRNLGIDIRFLCGGAERFVSGGNGQAKL